MKVSSIWNKAFTVLSGVAILSEKRLHLFQMSPSRAQKNVLWATYTPNTFLSFSQKDNGYIFYSMKDTGGWKDSRSWTGWWNIWAIVLLFNLMHAFQWVYQRLPDICGWRTLHKINILSSGDYGNLLRYLSPYWLLSGSRYLSKKPSLISLAPKGSQCISLLWIWNLWHRIVYHHYANLVMDKKQGFWISFLF